jgi:nitrogen fixation NifU-like protein|tara:strand:+ start:3474 stop:3872 length:399 start_codon:yes stop_codon:yes gene_type:complete
MDLKILEIASNTENNKIIENFTHLAKRKNPICGDEIQISLKVVNNKILDFGYQSKSCIYCQASASLLSKNIKNKKINIIRELIKNIDTFFIYNSHQLLKKWPKFKFLFNKKNISRKDCLLLPFKTLNKALKL